MKTPRSNSIGLILFLSIIFLLLGIDAQCQTDPETITEIIASHLEDEIPEKNEVFIQRYRQGAFDDWPCSAKGKMLHLLGLGLYYQNKENEAIAIFREALEKVWKNCDAVESTEKANTSFNIGVCYQYTAEAAKGRLYIEQAMKTFTADKNYARADLCQKYQGAANFFSTLKDFTKAEFYYKAAENLSQALGAEDQFHLHNEIFVLYLNFGEWKKARGKALFLTQWVDKHRKEIDAMSIAILHLNKAELWLKTGESDKVFDECKTALTLLPKEEAEFISNAHEILGVYFLEKKDYTQSQYHYQKAYQLRSLSQNIVQANLAKAFSIENMAEIALQTKEYERAIQLIQEAMALLTSPCGIDRDGNPILNQCITANGIHLMRQLLLKQKIHLEAGKAKQDLLWKASKISPKLDTLSDIVLQQAYLDESKLYLLHQLSDKTENQLKTTLALFQKTGKKEYLAAGADIVSGSKSFILRQYLDQNKLLYLKKENGKFETIFDLREKLGKLRSTIETSQVKEDSLYAQANALMVMLEEEEKKTGLTARPDKSQDVLPSRSMANLPVDVKIIESFCGSDSVHFFIYDQHDLKHHQLERKGIEKLIQKLKTSLVNPGQPYDKTTAAQVWKQCFASWVDTREVKTLVFVPDGFFHGLPLEALIDDQGRFLVERIQIQYGHSSQLLFKEPSKESYQREFSGFATPYSSALNDKIKQHPYFHGIKLQSLHNALAEIETSSRGFSKKIFFKEAATTNAFKQYGPGSRYLYFSLHGIANEENGSLSALLFDDQSKDFVLHSYEINAIPLNAELVVLSSCQSAGGKVFSAEGIQGLTRSFLLAGCQRVVSSFWNASEQSANAILTHFMKLVAAGENSAAALSKAKTEYLRTASPSQKHPYYWAGFVLTGQLEKDPGNSLYWIWVLTLTALALAIFMWKKKK